MAFDLAIGWRRGPSGGQGQSQSGAALALGAAIGGGATAAMTLTVASEQAETTALVGRMAVAPSAARRGLIDQLIAGAKADGVWGKLDWLIVAAAHDAQAARLNWVAAKSAAAVNASAFTIDRGFAGDGASAWLDLGEAITAGGRFTQNAASLGVWINAGSVQRYDIGVVEGTSGSNSIWLRIGSGGVRAGRLNSGGLSFVAPSGVATGHSALVRPDAATVRQFADGVMIQSGTSTSVSPGGTPCLLRAGTNYSDHRIAAAWTGGALSDAEAAALHARLNSYLTAIGGN